jgi:hypothetical protein
METEFKIYMVGWGAALLIGAVVFVIKRKTILTTCPGYFKFLAMPWKVITFVIAATGMTVIAPYTGDPTWDYIDALFMSVLTYLSAPWSVGILYRAIRKQAGGGEAYIAACLWLFSASWSYDLYIVLRDGIYPPTWLANLYLSSILYLLAGLLWNLDWTAERRLHFAFMKDGWPAPNPNPVFTKLLWLALPLMLFVAILILAFLEF